MSPSPPSAGGLPPDASSPQSQPMTSSLSADGAPRSAMERQPVNPQVSLRAAYRSNNPTSISSGAASSNGNGSVGTIRAVTPEMGDLPDQKGSVGGGGVVSDAPYLTRGLASHESSPRSIAGGGSRRQGMVFDEAYVDPYESGESSPPPLPSRLNAGGPIRPRTRTMDAAMLTSGGQRAQPPGAAAASAAGNDSRNRVGSLSSSGSPAISGAGDADLKQPIQTLESMGFPTILGNRTPENAGPSKKTSNRRLVKRQSSRPASPPIIMAPIIDCLPYPIPVERPDRIMLLMRTLAGKMSGEIEYQGENGGPWHSGMAYIDDEKACLVFDSGQSGPFHIPLVSDLRGCRVLPVDYPDAGKKCLELVSSSPVIEILICPTIPDEFDLWLASLLCWQQLKPSAFRRNGTNPSSPVSPVRPELKRRGISSEGAKSNIIKVGKVMAWDKGYAVNPKALIHRSSSRDQLSPAMSWKMVSCILHDNGEFKLMSDSDGTLLSNITLSQLSRCGIQQLDRSVLDEENCIAIFPMYAASAEQVSIFKPVYLSLENQVHFEVWFALLRAFAVPDVYKLDNPDNGRIEEIDDVEREHKGEVFRVEKTITVRVTEAKFKTNTPPAEQMRPELDPLIGNYLAEVTLDGEVRSRTTVKTNTKNPFWREDCEFTDLPPSTPHLAINIKRVDVVPETPDQGSATKVSYVNETICGFVAIPWTLSEPRSKDPEQWLQVMNDKHEPMGTMLIKVNHEEHVVLLAKEYQPLAELLHSFPSGLTTMISSALPGQLRRLAELFLNIFQVSGSAGDWLMALVEDEMDGLGNQATIKKYRFGGRLKSNESAESNVDRRVLLRDMGKSLAGEANLLFRGNTLLTQSLEFHMRRLSRDLLEELLRDKVYEINELNPDCEVDPSKLSHNLGDLDAHWDKLINLTTDVWMCIAGSAKRLHPELRHILKYVRAVAEDRYGDFSFSRTASYTAVSGFLFLRFICPAILSPKLFGLLRDHPRPRAQRTFTLIAKALQKMANMSAFGKREEWMEPMNRFLNAQKGSFKDYIDAVCDIPAERGASALPASYSTPVTILGRLGPTAREGFPSLPFLIDQARNYASLIKLWVDTKPVEAREKDEELEGDLLVFNELCSALQHRADACLAKLASVRPEVETPAEVEELAELLEQASLIEAQSFSYGSPVPWGEENLNLRFPPRPISAGSDAGESGNGDIGDGSSGRRSSKEFRRGRDIHDARRAVAGGFRHVSGTAAAKVKNGKKGRTILSGLMRMGGRSDSPDSKGQK